MLFYSLTMPIASGIWGALPFGPRVAPLAEWLRTFGAWAQGHVFNWRITRNSEPTGYMISAHHKDTIHSVRIGWIVTISGATVYQPVSRRISLRYFEFK